MKNKLLWSGDDGEDCMFLYWSETLGYFFRMGDDRVDVSLDDLLVLADVIERETK